MKIGIPQSPIRKIPCQLSGFRVKKGGRNLMADTNIFLEVFRPQESELRAYIGAMVRDAHAREDVFQEVSRTLWEKFGTFDATRSFGAWARGVATLKLLEAGRKNARFPLTFPPETIEALQAAFDATESPPGGREEALAECLKSVPEKGRRLLALRYEEDRRGPEIARTLGLSLEAVHKSLSRLRQQLEVCIRRRLEGGPSRENP